MNTLVKFIDCIPVKVIHLALTRLIWWITPSWFKLNSVKSECYEFYFSAIDYLNTSIAVCSDGNEVYPQVIKNNRVGYLTVATSHQLALNELFDICGFIKYMSVSNIIAGMIAADKDIGCMKTLIKHITIGVNITQPLDLWNESQIKRRRSGTLTTLDVITIIDRFNQMACRTDDSDEIPEYPTELLKLVGLNDEKS